MKKLLTLSILLCTLTACSPSTINQSEETHPIAMPNPASKYCIDLGGTLQIVDGQNGQYGMCILPDGTKIEEWELFRRDHPAS